MEIRMKQSILVGALMVVTTAALTANLGAQQAGQSDVYQGTSSPPPDDTITTSAPPEPAAPAPKPSPAHPAYIQPAPAQYQAQPQPDTQIAQQPVPVNSALSAPADGTDDGIVQTRPDQPPQPPLNRRAAANDPDGDIVHPAPLGPGELGEGTTIRARLLEIGRASCREIV